MTVSGGGNQRTRPFHYAVSYAVGHRIRLEILAVLLELDAGANEAGPQRASSAEHGHALRRRTARSGLDRSSPHENRSAASTRTSSGWGLRTSSATRR